MYSARSSRSGSVASSRTDRSDASHIKQLNLKKRQKLKTILVQKLSEKYGGVAAADRFIDEEVDRFINSGKVTEDNLTELENKVQMKTQGFVDRAGQFGDDHVSTLKQFPPRYRKNKFDEWAAIVIDDVKRHESEQSLQANRKKRIQEQQRLQLDEQVKYQQMLRSKDADDEATYALAEREQLIMWKESEKAKQDKVLERNSVLQGERQQQLDFIKQRRQHERKQKAKEEKVEITRIKSDLQKQREDEVEKKHREKDFMERMKQENARALVLKAQESAKERELDQHYMEEYRRQLEKQEAMRNRVAEQMADRQKRLMAMGAVVHNKKVDLAAQDEERARLEQEKYNKLKNQEEAMKKEKRRAAREDLRHTLEKQMREKEQGRKVEEQRVSDQATLWKKDIEEAERKEILRRQRQKEKNLKHRLELEKQMHENINRLKTAGLGMSTWEKRLNKPLLDGLGEDEAPAY